MCPALKSLPSVLFRLDDKVKVKVGAAALLSFFGAAKSDRPSENTARVERFAAGRVIVTCDLDVAREYGRLIRRLREKGRPLPENDIWIAAQAMETGAELVTLDRHFERVAGLAVTIERLEGPRH